MILPLPSIYTILEHTNDIDIRCSFGIYRKLSGSYDTLKALCIQHTDTYKKIKRHYNYERWYYFIRRRNRYAYENSTYDNTYDCASVICTIPYHILRMFQFVWNKEFLSRQHDSDILTIECLCVECSREYRLTKSQ